MITVLVRVTHGPEALAATLSALVPAVAEGLVGDAVILCERQDSALAMVADAAGATLVVADGAAWAEGAKAARRDWLLCLDDGDIPQEGWIRAVDRFVSLAGPQQSMARLCRRAGLLRAWAEAMGRRFAGTPIRAGDLVHRRILIHHGKPRAPVRLAATIERDPVFH
ncbi:hypothetical protein JKG68_08425 [Microvirga aerilata]|uniref:Glycosyl transferase n=1 Tax=Microvirga aerilata TaxID=670292 RepID=A0A936ZDX4_9HYPH|nr:hypothetical protein [Microvirga aerilata]MBL0403985.1 hypothetical protein [Microvirga aerilata]